MEKVVQFKELDQIAGLFGSFDSNIKRLEKRFSVTVTNHNDEIKISGNESNVLQAVKAVVALKEYLVKGYNVNSERFKNNSGGVYFEELLEKIRDIRSSKKVSYRKCICELLQVHFFVV